MLAGDSLMRKSKRIPLNQVAEIERLLNNGVRFKALMARYGELAARLALASTYTRRTETQPGWESG